MENLNIQTSFLGTLLEKMPFGIVVTKNDNEIVIFNTLLSQLGDSAAIDYVVTFIKEKDLVPEVNTPIRIYEQNMLVRKEILDVGGEKFQMFLLLLPHMKNDFFDRNIHEELLFKDAVEFAYDGLVMVDQDGYVQMLSRPYAEFLGVNQESSIGKHVTEVIENTRMHIVPKTGIQETAQLQKIKDDYIIATRSPVMKNGQVVGAVGKILFKNVGQFSALSKRIKSLESELKKYKGDFRETNKASYTFESLMGRSKVFLDVKKQATKAALSDSNVLILGESGTGKELFAHAIHNESKRAMGVFVKVNCAAIPAELLESELFGYEEGSFTGAKKGGKAGKFEAADGGTIFLDEIGDLPLHMQVKLLRVLQEKEIERVGSTSSIAVDVRILAATNRDLEEMVSNGEFRLDLYYRLKVMEIKVPSLKERTSDIELLAGFFLEKYKLLMKKEINGVKESAMRHFNLYSWPGNIRELENIIERALNIVDDGDWISEEHLPFEMTGFMKSMPIRTLHEVMEEIERNTILASLSALNGNKTETAKQLGISRTTLYEKMNKYRLE